MLARPAAGFTMIEMLIAVAIGAILLAIGVPVLRGYIENGHIRMVRESWASGLTMARAESVRLNTLVTFTTSTHGWSVQTLNGTAMHQGSGLEGTTDLTLTFTPTGSTTVTFNQYGQVMSPNPGDNSAPITQIDVAASHPSGLATYTPLRIQMLSSGLARLCNPAAATTDPSACL